ncbi:UDP-N-acetylmuramoyl-L-alanyl-D-glutamate--2,6-diaminopimelate ligase [Buchnera aphidicola (Muscaphis stroyani)]|uniref:UDP-N-acetylmuramoyl-L-alanyl-D-glutamate--2,6-diaminopimelate ligase n=1 Tax=Buchnera aphidicola (Muscaphis stroyani) TaxID=1241869 RepID=A0A4D6YER2_9GAMM|nr:UDP-N-acetylmuramoyl-L-alanyl-D-glutamate--2,6-diaminopimelate ligase [Buchnera aphidicola]QCI24308.1 UDP-N-acetylmuramoyl-L-alanyl-D-glutamate--2,6-diaminopimelate ligase [Buchnera aphidicola (Muscaphis stroyani)]
MKRNNLKDLLSPWMQKIPERAIQNITINSKKTSSGDLFVAIKGSKKDGRKFIFEAIQNKVSAILYETQDFKKHGIFYYIKNIPIIYFFQLPIVLSSLSSRFYHEPGNKLKIIGITGTNGKTTVAHLISQWSTILGKKSVVMGTLGNGDHRSLKPTMNTTSSAVFIQSFLKKALINKTDLVSMEVSSHGLVQNRVKNVPFYIAIFTNLTPDHLDYHKSMKEYEKSKWSFFTCHKVKKIILNASDKYGQIWLKKLFNHYTIAVTIEDDTQKKYSNKWMNATNIKFKNNHMFVKFESSWGSGKIFSYLIGNFNVTNLLLSMACLLELGYKLSDLIRTVNQLKAVCGRMQQFYGINHPTFIIDYAHTPDALENTLKTIKTNYKKKLWCIFGCGGERDRTKRSLMGAIAEKESDQVIITNDNPRREEPFKIIQDILKGCKKKDKILIIPNRRNAISHAFFQSKINDIILIAGKGHENQQIIGNQYINYSDQKTVLQLMGKKI